MRIAAEAIDDVFMNLFVFERLRISQRSEERLGICVDLGRLRVHKRQVRKEALLGRELPIKADRDQLLREKERLPIVGEGRSRASKEVARELIEYNHLRQR